MLICDTHADTLYALQSDTRDASRLCDVTLANLTATRPGDAHVQALALWTGPEALMGRDVGVIDREMLALARLEEQGFHQVRDVSEALPGKANYFLTIEGGEVFETGLQTVDAFALWGVRAAAIVWNHENNFAFPAVSGSDKGLTSQGKALIARMNRQHMAVDVSHLNIAGVKDALTVSKAPIIATHSCCRALCDHPRNLSDDQLKAIFDMGGYVGINFFPLFLHPSNKATVDTVIDHVDHMTQLGGAKHIGMGSDFDGIETHPEGLENAGCVYALLDRMKTRGYTDEAISDFAGENLKRYFAKL